MFCVPIVGPTFLEASSQIDANKEQAHLFEFRADLFDDCNIDHLKKLAEQSNLPIIFTLRKQEQGGGYKRSEKERLSEILQVAQELSPAYLDLDHDTPKEFIEEISHQFPKIKLILSYHNFTETPSDLEALLERLKEVPADLYKIACRANSTADSLRMLHFAKKHAPLLAICMGEKGQITRILGPLVGAPWTYAADQKPFFGQLPIQELASTYAIGRLTSQAAIYGLIGNPVSKSISHHTHNKTLQNLTIDAVYIKMALEKEELYSFFNLSNKMGIKGLSVTMPYKEAVLPFLDHLDEHAKKIGAVNTIVCDKGRFIGYNTDGKGALDAIEAKGKVHGKMVVVLGAGGAARAIVYEACLRGAEVWVLNRTKEKALKLAAEFGVQGGGLDALEELSYDILINATAHLMPISPAAICPHTLVMDIHTRPKMTDLLQHAVNKGCTLVFGFEMFVNQALEQYVLWFSSTLDRSQLETNLYEAALEYAK